MSNEKTQLREILLQVYDRRQDEVSIGPISLANDAMAEMDPDGQSPPMVRRAAHLHLRQIAREILRQKFQPDDVEEDQIEMEFPALQSRYPKAHKKGEEPEYVFLEHMEEEDIGFNANRLRREARSKERHADTLEAWWQGRNSHKD